MVVDIFGAASEGCGGGWVVDESGVVLRL